MVLNDAKEVIPIHLIASKEKLVPLTYTEIHGNRLRGNDPADSFVEGYSRNHLFKGKRDAKTLDEWVVSDTATKELEPFHSLSKHRPKETCRGDASPTYPCNYMSAMKESNEVQKVNAGLIGGSLKTTTRLQRSESESRVRPFLLDTTGRVDEPLKMWSSSRYAQSQRLRNPQNRPHDRGSVLSPTSNILSGFSASSSFFNENQMRPAEGTTTRHKLPDRNSDGEAGLLRRDSDGEVETSSGDSRDRRKRGVSYLHHPYRSIIDVADDDSYEAHYDRLCSSKAKARALDPGSGPVPVPMLRGKKELQRGRNSDEILAFMIQQDDNRMRSEVKKSTCQRADGGLRNDKVTLLENRILDRISGHLGTLRHSLFRSDLSRSGEVSFNEFRSAVQHCGVDMSSADLQEVFGDFVDAKLEKGSANGHAVRSHDLRHFNSVAINIERFTEHLARRIEERSGAGGTERSVEHQRARKKVLRASCKHDDPMSVFQYLNCADSGNHAEGDQDVVGTGTGTDTGYGHVPPEMLKSGLQYLGSNLTDREFEYLLHKVGTSHDGKISVSEFYRIINSATASYDARHSQAQRESMKEASTLPLLPNSKSKSNVKSLDNNSNDLIGAHDNSEFDLPRSGKTDRTDGALWDSLSRLMQSNSTSFPAAFKSIALSLNPRPLVHSLSADKLQAAPHNRESRQDSRGVDPGSGPAWGSGLTRSCSLDAMDSRAAGRYRHLGPDGSSPAGAEVTGRVGNRSGSGSSSSSSSGGQKDDRQGSSPEGLSTACLPMSQIRNILSGSGMQLGNTDAVRLNNMLARRLSESHTFTGHTMDLDSQITLDQFCDIVGIPVDGKDGRSNREIQDPRSIPSDRAGPRPRPYPPLPQPGIAHMGYNRIQAHMDREENKQRDHSSVFRDGSFYNPNSVGKGHGHRRYAVRPDSERDLALQPSRFWELQRAGRQRDTFPIQLNSYKDGWAEERRERTKVGSSSRGSSTQGIVTPPVAGTISESGSGCGIGSGMSSRKRSSSAIVAPTVTFETRPLASPTPVLPHSPKTTQKGTKYSASASASTSASASGNILPLPSTKGRAMSAPAAGRAVEGRGQSGDKEKEKQKQPKSMRGTRSLVDFAMLSASEQAPSTASATASASATAPALVPTAATSSSTHTLSIPQQRVAFAPTPTPITGRLGGSGAGGAGACLGLDSISDICNRINGYSAASRSEIRIDQSHPNVTQTSDISGVKHSRVDRASPRVLTGGALFPKPGVNAPIRMTSCVSTATFDTTAEVQGLRPMSPVVERSSSPLPSPRRAAQGSHVLVGGGGKKRPEGGAQ